MTNAYLQGVLDKLDALPNRAEMVKTVIGRTDASELKLTGNILLRQNTQQVIDHYNTVLTNVARRNFLEALIAFYLELCWIYDLPDLDWAIKVEANYAAEQR